MNNRLIITKRKDKIISCLLEENRPLSIRCWDVDTSIVGNIYIAKVQNVVKNINAAFVEIEKGFPCYLPLADCKKPYLCNREFKGTLIQGDEILVQVVRDRTKTKEPVVTTNLSFSGRYSVISTGNTHIGYSKNLTQDEKRKLKEITLPYFEKGFGYIMRTNVVSILNRREDCVSTNDCSEYINTGHNILINEIQELTRMCKNILSIAKSRTVFSCLYQTLPEYILEVRDTKRNTINSIITDDSNLHNQLSEYMKTYQLHSECELVFYDDTTYSLHKLIGLEKIIDNSLGKKVWLKSGGYLIIEQTEALSVVDVNTGKYTSKKSMEETFYKINIEAAYETARQLRLRNLSGIIIIDFINMENLSNQENLLMILQEACNYDPIKTIVIDITPLGLVELTRKRVHPTLKEQLQENIILDS